jgi:hypothetical protein
LLVLKTQVQKKAKRAKGQEHQGRVEEEEEEAAGAGEEEGASAAGGGVEQGISDLEGLVAGQVSQLAQLLLSPYQEPYQQGGGRCWGPCCAAGAAMHCRRSVVVPSAPYPRRFASVFGTLLAR